MIRVEQSKDLKGAERFGECSNCGTNEDISKITFYDDNNTQQHSFRLCKECSQELINTLISAGMVY